MPLVRANLQVILCERRTLPLETDSGRVPKNEEKIKEVKRCIFGPSNPEETKKMLEEQYERDRRRFIDRYGFDIAELDEEVKENSKVRVSRKRRFAENVLKPCNKQARLTDIYQIKKRYHSSAVKDKEEV